jgi:ribulose-5-phosphate 4-epimerase/fuculose-1-phosphate aldolase
MALSLSSVLAQIKVNILGEVVEKGSSCFPVDTTGFCLHSAIYAARPDVRCVIHLHTPATAAVSGALPALWPLHPASLSLYGSQIQDTHFSDILPKGRHGHLDCSNLIIPERSGTEAKEKRENSQCRTPYLVPLFTYQSLGVS